MMSYTLNPEQLAALAAGYPSAEVVRVDRATDEPATPVIGRYAARATLSTGTVVTFGQYGAVLSETPATPEPAAIVPVVVAGGKVTHAGRPIGSYPSGAVRYRKVCGGNGAARHEPHAAMPGSPITCKRCAAKLAGMAPAAPATAPATPEPATAPEPAPATPNTLRPDTSALAAQLAQLIGACARLRAPATPATAPAAILPRVAELRELAALAGADTFHGARMSGAQYAELCEVAARAELARARSAGSGLRLTPAQYAEVSAELAAVAALAGMERARAVDIAQGVDTPRGYAPRWTAVYAETFADAGTGAEWSTLHGAPRAQLARNRWVHWLRFAARHELSLMAERARAESADDAGAELAAEPAAHRFATAERTAAQLAAQLSDAGRPMGKLETHAVAGILCGLSHRERAEVMGSTPEACKTYAAKGRAALRKRWIVAGAARAELAGAARAADAADLAACAELRGIPSAVLRRAERNAARRDELADARRNAERGTSGHAGGVIRTMPTAATPEDGSGQLSRVESIGKGNVSHAVHRGHAPAYRRDGLIVAGMAHRARMDRAARTARRARYAAIRAAGADPLSRAQLRAA